MIPLSVPGFRASAALLDIDAGLPMVPLYDEAVSRFPILGGPRPIHILPDTPAGSWGLAWYQGLDGDGHPQFAVRDDVALNPKIGYHESGHAFEDVLGRAYTVAGLGGFDAIRAAYWNFRSFPGTWYDAITRANQQTGVGGAWPYLPGESWAETFSAAVSGTVLSEWTFTYQRDLALTWWISPGNGYDPTGGAMRAREFFLDLMARLPEWKEDDMFTDADRAMLKRVYDHLEAEEPKVWIARDQRGRDVETGTAFDASKPPVDPRISK